MSKHSNHTWIVDVIEDGSATIEVDGRTVTTAEGRETFDAVVIAAGPWTHEFVPWLALTVERQVMVWLAIESGARWLLPERFPVFIRQTDDFGDIYGLKPALEGVTSGSG